MRLILTRHGITEENKRHILQGHIPGRLSEEGKEQARRLAERLKNESIEYIYSSDLARAADTARIIAEYYPSVPLYLVPELRETDLRKYTGSRWEDVDKKEMFENIEPRESVRDRVKGLLDKVYDIHPNSTVLFVGHDGVNKALIRHIQGLPLDAPLEHAGNTAVNIFDIEEDGNHKVHLIGCTKHLD